MKVDALLTCAVINIGVCTVLFSIHSILKRKPCNVVVYFGRRLEVIREKHSLEPLVPSSSWIGQAWVTSEEELLNIGGLDAVVFCRILVFSIQIFSIATSVCLLIVLPVNFYGEESRQRWIKTRSLDVFTIANVPAGSKWLWMHCLALYIITCSTCFLLYFNYKSITSMRRNHIVCSPPNPSHFAILVRSIPWSPQQSYSESVKKFFSKYHASGYLSHQMVYKCGTVERMKSGAEKVWKSCSEKKWKPTLADCGLCGSKSHSFRILSGQSGSVASVLTDSSDSSIAATRDKECAAAFVFFKTRFDAVVASKLLQSTHPMLWVTELAPEPHDVCWSNLCIPYHQLWLRRIATVLGAVVFVFAFLAPVTFVQGLTQVEHLQEICPSLRRALKSTIMKQLITGYLPSVILILFLCTVPPAMMISSAAEGCVSRSQRKMSACRKVLYFTIWNVYFVNVLSGSVITPVIERPKEILNKIAKAVPMQASFFMALSLTSGWASLAWEIMQFFPLVRNWFKMFILKQDTNASYAGISFPYQTEFPKILLFGLIGFNCSIMAPLVLPFTLAYYVLAFFVYKNQFLNVYSPKYDNGGRFWPIAYNTTIFSLVLTQVTAIGVFGLRGCPHEASSSFPLVIGTLLFYMYCRRRFKPTFTCNTAIEVLVEMDMRDQRSGKLKKIYEELHPAYCQAVSVCQDSSLHSHGSDPCSIPDEDESTSSSGSSKIESKSAQDDDAWSTCGDVGVQHDLIRI